MVKHKQCPICLSLMKHGETIVCRLCATVIEMRHEKNMGSLTPSITQYENATIKDLQTHFTDVLLIYSGEDDIYTNVPQIIAHHSPGGFQIGYNGSGPADFALNLCELSFRYMGIESYIVPDIYRQEANHLCSFYAYRIHQDVKERFISGLAFGEDYMISWKYFVDNIVMQVFAMRRKELEAQNVFWMELEGS